MTSFVLIMAFLFVPMFLSFLAVVEMSKTQDSEAAFHDSCGDTTQLRPARSPARVRGRATSRQTDSTMW
ncbi:hypothetical protein [Terripilifer ovatus]|uniref:hypothetical protein n=1 Tax=Terripilifer ovatus TaxID=3032367 RepID=UPI003AB99793